MDDETIPLSDDFRCEVLALAKALRALLDPFHTFQIGSENEDAAFLLFLKQDRDGNRMVEFDPARCLFFGVLMMFTTEHGRSAYRVIRNRARAVFNIGQPLVCYNLDSLSHLLQVNAS